MGEIRRGIEDIDAEIRRQLLIDWLETDLPTFFTGRILSAVADRLGALGCGGGATAMAFCIRKGLPNGKPFISAGTAGFLKSIPTFAPKPQPRILPLHWVNLASNAARRIRTRQIGLGGLRLLAADDDHLEPLGQQILDAQRIGDVFK
ncbi:hypothetical protein H0A73_21115 [Alcaligenaceae bacterium]|nr:hypothetical protein [Alcaligenaceae bacterium]